MIIAHVSLDRVVLGYGERVVLAADASFGCGAHAVRGANGSGKSTLLRAIAGIELPAAGAIRIGEHALRGDALAAKARLGYQPDMCPWYGFMTARDLFEVVAAAKKVRVDAQVEALAMQLGVAHLLDRPFAELSAGGRRKAAIIAALIGDPQVVLLDEPTNEIDREARHALVDLIMRERQRRCWIIATHDHEFVAAIGAERWDIIDGRLSAAA